MKSNITFSVFKHIVCNILFGLILTSTFTLHANPKDSLLTQVNFKIFASEICENAGLYVGLGGGTPIGGVYSGPGVTDEGNGKSYSFDPSIAGPGLVHITYTVNQSTSFEASSTDSILVKPIPQFVAFTAPEDLSINSGIRRGLSGGFPVEGTKAGDDGVYYGAGVTDNNDGTYDFDPEVAGIGTHLIAYAYTEDDGTNLNCVALASDIITVYPKPYAGEDGIIDIIEAVSLNEENLFRQLKGNPNRGGQWTDASGNAVVFPIKTPGIFTYTVNALANNSNDKDTATVTVNIKRTLASN